LNDDVDGDTRRAERFEDRGRDAGAVADADDGDLRDVCLLRDSAHSLAIFHGYVSDDHRTDAIAEARPDVDRHAVQLADLHRAGMHHARAARGQLEHLVVLDVGQLPSRLHDARVRGEDAVDVGVDLAGFRTQRGGKRDRGGVRPSPTERRDLELFGHALKACDHWDLLLAERFHDAVRLDVADARARVVAAGLDARLRT